MSLFIGYAKNYAKNLLQRGPGVPGRVKNISVALYHRPPSGLALFTPVLIGTRHWQLFFSPIVNDSGEL